MKKREIRGQRSKTFRRFEALESRMLLAGDMTNPGSPLDVNDDAEVSARDALAIINYLGRQNAAAEGELAPAVGSDGDEIYPDTSGNGSVTASDALRVINALGIQQPETISELGEEAAAMGMVPNTISIDPGSNPRIEISGKDQTIVITTPAANKLHLEGPGLSETIDIRYDLHIEVTGRANKLIFSGATVPDDLFVTFVGTQNKIRLNDTYVGDDFIFRGSRGADVVVMDNFTLIEDDAIIRTYRGHDQVLIKNAGIGDDFILHTHYGQDILAVDGAEVGDDAIVRMGDNNDTVSLRNVGVRDVASVQGDARNDALGVDSVSARRYSATEFEFVAKTLPVQSLIDQCFEAMGDDDDDDPV